MKLDELETQTPEAREQRLFHDFRHRLQQATARHPGLSRHLQSHSLKDIHDRASLARLPILRKSALMQAQCEFPPFGGFADANALSGSRLFMSPGPVWEPQLCLTDPWQSARALRAAGFARGDIVHNAFSYHLTPGGFILDEGARAMGCLVFPAGVGNTDTQVTALRHSGAVAYTGTPDYLKTLLDHATAQEEPLQSLERALVSGGALFPAMRDEFREAGIFVLQCYATADFGVIAYESATDGFVHDGMLINEELIVEIVQPGTGDPVAHGEVGEVVVTRLHPDFPLLRFGTGDLSAFIDEPSPCGRTNRRIKGWMGRADQRTKVRGMFVDPEQIQAIRSKHPAIERLRLIVGREFDKDIMTLRFVVESGASAPEAEHLGATLKRLCNLTGQVERVDSLPADGIVIEDIRDLAVSAS